MSDTVEVLAQLRGAIDDFKARHGARLDEVEAAIGDLARGNAARLLNGVGAPADPAYSTAFAAYFRSGTEEHSLKQANATGYRANIHASMSVADPSSGGYVAPTEWDRKVQQELLSISPMRRIAQVRSTSVGAFSTLWNSRGMASGWVA